MIDPNNLGHFDHKKVDRRELLEQMPKGMGGSMNVSYKDAGKLFFSIGKDQLSPPAGDKGKDNANFLSVSGINNEANTSKMEDSKGEGDADNLLPGRSGNFKSTKIAK